MKKRFLRKILILAFWLLLWQVAALLIHNSILFVSPLETAKALAENLKNQAFWQVVGMTLLRIGVGFVAGLALGVLLAAACRVLPFLEEVLTPVISLMKTVPVVCFVVLFLIWWGPSFLSIAISFLMVFTAVFFSTLEGLRAVGKGMLEMADVFRLPGKSRIFYIYRPALRPFLMGSLKSALGFAWKSGVAAEVIGLPAYSIGERLYLSKISLDTAGIFAWTVVVCLLSFLFEKGVLFLADRFFDLNVRVKAPHGANIRSNLKKTRTSEKREVYHKLETSEKQGIQIKNLCKSYGSQSVLKDYSLRISDGETHWFTTPSGSGKTTLFRMLIGLEKPDQGKIIGADRLTYAVLFQEDRLCEDYSAILNVKLVTGEEKRAREILEALLESELLTKPCKELSGGEKRRVALARALAAEGDCLILDEPFAGVDQENARKAWQEIQKRKGSKTLLIASHVGVPE